MYWAHLQAYSVMLLGLPFASKINGSIARPILSSALQIEDGNKIVVDGNYYTMRSAKMSAPLGDTPSGKAIISNVDTTKDDDTILTINIDFSVPKALQDKLFGEEIPFVAGKLTCLSLELTKELVDKDGLSKNQLKALSNEINRRLNNLSKHANEQAPASQVARGK